MTESAVCITQINFTTKLKSILASSKITYKDLAEACDISYIFLKLFINNKKSGNIKLFIKIANCLNIPLSELFYEDSVDDLYSRYVSIVPNNTNDYKEVVRMSTNLNHVIFKPKLIKNNNISDSYFDFCIEMIKSEMARQNITVTKLSQISTVSRSFLYDLLKKKFVPSIDVIESLIFALDGKVWQYFSTEEECHLNIPEGMIKYYLLFPKKLNLINKQNLILMRIYL